jgi:nitrogen fixation NifU-like protein
MNLNQLYSKKVLYHFRHPKNMGEIKNPDGVATVGNRICGDVMRLYVKLGKNKKGEYVKDIKFQTLGCGAAIATSSILTTMVKGKSLSEAQKVGNQAIVKALDGLPPAKIHCSLLAASAFKKAIADYQKKRVKSK